MNERIKQLAEQATVSEPYYPAGNDGHPEYRIYVSQEKFAELLIRECATLAFDGPNGILEHFGVDQGHPEEACDDEECYDVDPDW